MKVSTKGRYGIRLMLDLAIHYSKGLVTLKEIAIRQEISEKYLEQIIMQLNKSDYVKSVRGSQGGYMLAADPSAITVGAILRLMEGSLAPVECVSGSNPSCNRVSTCVTIGVWQKVKDAIENVVDNITLADLVEEYYAKSSFDYVI